MGKNKGGDVAVAVAGAASNAKPTSKDAKQEKVSFSAMVTSIDQKPEKPIKASTKAPKVSSYIDGIDLTPSLSDEEIESRENDQAAVSKKQLVRQQRNECKSLDISMTDKQLKKREIKDIRSCLSHRAGQKRGP
ncbi:general control non-repressible 4 [Euphorbia peplus]|nr:general control non-repressible 4 [Euphorbia peplus]